MPSLPQSRNEPLAATKSNKFASNMTGGTANAVNENCETLSSPTTGAISSSTSDTASAGTGIGFEKLSPEQPGNKNQRNRGHAKIKLLVRSHAMRESTSPPRESNGLQPPQEPEQTSIRNTASGSARTKQQINNNEPILDDNDDGNETADSTSVDNCANSTINGIMNSPEVISSNNSAPPLTNEVKMDRESPTEIGSCGNCGTNGGSGLLQTPSLQNLPTPKSAVSHKLQHSPKSTNLAQQIHHNNERNRGEQLKPNNTSSSSTSSFTCNVPCSNNCGNNNGNNINNNNNTLSVSRPGSRHKLRHRNVSQGSFDTSPSISRDSSTELYTDSTGIDLEQFIGDTLNRNQKDRTVLLRIERELVEFARDRQRACHKFPNMSSYNRMLVHRVAAYFGMEHNVDQTGLCVVVTRTKNTRIPDTRFKESIRDDIVLTEEPKRSILKRDSNSFEDNFNFKSPDRFIADYCRRSKSFEEREEEYERARRRIFKDSSGESTEATSWPWSSAESSDASAKPPIPHALVPEDGNRQSMFLKVESFYEGESLRRPSVPKSYSFGGYTGTGGMLSRDNSITSTRSAGARLTKQDSSTSTCSRLSPSSSGYKSQSQRSDATISPSPSPSPVMRGAGSGRSNSQVSTKETAASSSPEGVNSQQTVIWAVTNMSSVPAGSVIIDPLTNMPYKNSDGTIYRFDPENPPKISNEQRCDKRQTSDAAMDAESPRAAFPPPKNQAQDSAQNKRRSRYEKNNNNNNINNSHQQNTAGFTNSSTSPSLPFDPQNSHPHSHQTPHNQQQRSAGLHQPAAPLMKNYNPIGGHVYNPGQQISPQTGATAYTGYATPTNNNQPTNGQGVYLVPCPRPPSAIAISPYPSATQIRVESTPQALDRGDLMTCCNQNPVIAGYQVPGVQTLPPQTYEEVAELSGSVVGMNLYDQRAAGDGQPVPIAQQSYQHSPQTSSHPMHRVQPGSPAYWPSHPGQIPQVQQTMYFMPPSPASIPNSQNPVDVRQHLQRFAYSLNHPAAAAGVAQTNQPTPNYGGYPAPTIPGIPGMQSPQGEFAYQPTAHVIPAYYNPGQPNMQTGPVVYGVPTPPNTPTNNQMTGVAPLMYVNSNGYGPSTLIASNAFAHQVPGNGGQPAPSYMGPALMSNVMLQQAVPVIAGIRASTPSRRASRSPDACHEIFASGARDRNAQPQYQLPMRPGVHIVQGVAGNPRLQYATAAPSPLPASSVGQGCARPYRIQSYTSPNNISNERPRNSFDNRNEKLIRKHR